MEASACHVNHGKIPNQYIAITRSRSTSTQHIQQSTDQRRRNRGGNRRRKVVSFRRPRDNTAICQVYQLVTHSFAQQDCRRAHLKNPKCIKTLRPGLTGGDHRRRPPSWWVGVYHNTAPSPRTPSLAQPFGFRARLVPTIGGGLA